MTFLLTLLFAGLFAGQGIVLPNQGGTIGGVLRDSSGKPAVRVRVGAITQPERQGELAEASAMASIAETDEAGRYRLENIPPGKYYIAAGRVDFPTYYPGTQALGRATVLSVAPGTAVNGIDFAMLDTSARVAGPEFLLAGALTFTVGVKVTVDGGGKLPVFSPNGFMMIRLTNVTSRVEIDEPITTSTISAAGATSEFSVNVVNLPAGYSVKSIMAGTTDITKSTLKLSTLNFGTTAATPFGGVQIFPLGSMRSTSELSITLSRSGEQAAASSGARVTGRAPTTARRSIFISGKPGFFYSDGTFEFRGVPPGRHSIATLYNAGAPGALAASVVVGSRDVENIQLEPSPMLPFQIREAVNPGPAGAHPPGTAVPLASLRVAVVDETKQPATPGQVFILGPSGTSFDLHESGRFEMLRLLPGEYRFEVQAFGHPAIVRSVSIGDEDVTLELTVQ